MKNKILEYAGYFTAFVILIGVWIMAYDRDYTPESDKEQCERLGGKYVIVKDIGYVCAKLEEIKLE